MNKKENSNQVINIGSMSLRLNLRHQSPVLHRRSSSSEFLNRCEFPSLYFFVVVLVRVGSQVSLPAFPPRADQLHDVIETVRRRVKRLLIRSGFGRQDRLRVSIILFTNIMLSSCSSWYRRQAWMVQFRSLNALTSVWLTSSTPFSPDLGRTLLREI